MGVPMKKKILPFLILLFSGGLVILDQIFKWLAQTHLTVLPGRTWPLIQDVFHLTYQENRGAAFGILSGRKEFLIILTGAVLLVLAVLLLAGKINRPFLMWCAGLIIGGGVGNLIDRIFRQYVIDYLDFRLIHFAIFNFADCCVVVGTILFMAYLLFFDRTGSPAEKEQENG